VGSGTLRSTTINARLLRIDAAICLSLRNFG